MHMFVCMHKEAIGGAFVYMYFAREVWEVYVANTCRCRVQQGKLNALYSHGQLQAMLYIIEEIS